MATSRRPENGKARGKETQGAAPEGVAEGTPGIADDAPAGGLEAKEPVQYPGVLILRIPGQEPGQEDIQIIPTGGMDSLAVPMLLKLALKIHSNNFGLDN